MEYEYYSVLRTPSDGPHNRHTEYGALVASEVRKGNFSVEQNER